MAKLPNFSNKSNEAKDKIVMSAEIEKFMRLRSLEEEEEEGIACTRVSSRFASSPLLFQIRFLICCIPPLFLPSSRFTY